MSDILPDRKLTPRQVLAVEALLAGTTIRQAAAVARVNERTLRRWLGQPVMYSAIRDGSRELLDNTGRRLSAVMANAPGVVNEIMRDQTAPAAVRLQAARIALDAGSRLLELIDVVSRLDELEGKWLAKSD